MIHPPREGDLPREELLKAAVYATSSKGPWPGADILFKFTCIHCGERCTMQETNQLFEKGECFACGKETEIKFGGFAIHYVVGGENHTQP